MLAEVAYRIRDPDFARACPDSPACPRLKPELVVLTGARRRADLTIAVPLTASRLDRLEALCRHWGGPVSAAVYVAVFPGAAALMEVTRRSVQALFDRCYPCSACYHHHADTCLIRRCSCAAAAPMFLQLRFIDADNLHQACRRRRLTSETYDVMRLHAERGWLTLFPRQGALHASDMCHAIAASYRRVERDGDCQLEAVLYSERVADAAVSDLLPINALRNAATLPVRTAFVALLDVDLLPSRAFLPSFNAR